VAAETAAAAGVHAVWEAAGRGGRRLRQAGGSRHEAPACGKRRTEAVVDSGGLEGDGMRRRHVGSDGQRWPAVHVG
jgi:hypothetical protein